MPSPYNTYVSPIDRFQAIRGSRLANETRQTQNDTAGIQNQRAQRQLAEYDKTLKTTTLAIDSLEVLQAAPETRAQLIADKAAKDTTGFWEGGAGKTSQQLKQMLEMNVKRGKMIGAIPESKILKDVGGFNRNVDTGERTFPDAQAPAKDIRSPQLKLYDETQADPEFAASQEKGPSESESAKEAEIAAYEAMGIDHDEAVKHAYKKITVHIDPTNGMPSVIDVTTGEQRPVDSSNLNALTYSLPGDDTITEGDSLNLFSRFDSETSGIIPSIQEGLQETVGQLTGVNFQTEKTMIIRQDLKMLQKDLVRAMMDSGRFTATEMTSIEKEIDIAPSPSKGEVSMKAIFKSIDKNMRKRLVKYRLQAKSRYTLPADRADALIKQGMINDFIRDLGVQQGSEGAASGGGLAPEGWDPEDWKYVSEEDKRSILQ